MLRSPSEASFSVVFWGSEVNLWPLSPVVSWPFMWLSVSEGYCSSATPGDLVLFSWIFLSSGYLQWVPVLSAPDLSPFIPRDLGFIDGYGGFAPPRPRIIRTFGFLFWFVERCVAKHASGVFAGNFDTLPKGRFGTLHMPCCLKLAVSSTF